MFSSYTLGVSYTITKYTKGESTMAQHEEAHHHHDHSGHDHRGHHDHGDMVADFKKRFFISLIITIPILILSPMIQEFIGADWRFTGDSYILFALSTFVFFYGGWPFITGGIDELKDKNPGMMTLIGLAIWLLTDIVRSLSLAGKGRISSGNSLHS